MMGHRCGGNAPKKHPTDARGATGQCMSPENIRIAFQIAGQLPDNPHEQFLLLNMAHRIVAEWFKDPRARQALHLAAQFPDDQAAAMQVLAILDRIAHDYFAATDASPEIVPANGLPR
jgi:hypothetical protein